MSAYSKLRVRERRFVDAYVQTGMATKAARIIEPTSRRPDVIGSKLLARPEIRQAVDEREREAIAEAGLTTADIYRELKRIVNFDPLPHLMDGHDRPRRVREIPEHVRRAMRSFELSLDPQGRLIMTGKITGYDKLRALELNAKLKRLYTDTVEHKGIITLEQLVNASMVPKPDDGSGPADAS